MKSDWTRLGLERQGFSGWLPLRSVEAMREAPAAAGVYAVVFIGPSPIDWQPSCGGWFKGRDPSISHTRLRANWVDAAETVYIGKASSLKRRLVEFAKFGLGQPIGHWGGRILWHLPNPDELSVGWRLTPADIDPTAVEARLIENFREAFGKPPFANRPDRDGG